MSGCVLFLGMDRQWPFVYGEALLMQSNVMATQTLGLGLHVTSGAFFLCVWVRIFFTH